MGVCCFFYRIDSLCRLESLYASESYAEIATILKTTFGYNGNFPTAGRVGRPAQLAMLMHSLWYLDRTQCFVWTEVCLGECVSHLVKPDRDRIKWEQVLNKCIAILCEIIKGETVCIGEREIGDCFDVAANMWVL